MQAYVFLALAIFFEVVGTVSLKFSEGFTRVTPTIITLVGYFAAFYLLSLSLRSLSVGFTYAVWAGVGIVCITMIGVIFLNEKADIFGFVGIFLIVLGVVILNLFSKMSGS